jgi:hypothetical protein
MLYYLSLSEAVLLYAFSLFQTAQNQTESVWRPRGPIAGDKRDHSQIQSDNFLSLSKIKAESRVWRMPESHWP